MRRQQCCLPLHARCAAGRKTNRPAGADVSPRLKRPYRGPRDRQRNVAAAALLANLAGARDAELKLRIGQGVDMGRPSLLLTRVRKANGVIVSAHVGGACVQMMEGTFALAGEA